MRITRLEVDWFRSYHTAALDFPDRLTIVCGPNNAGKSSIVDAVAWCLTGRCRGTDAAGRNAAGLIHASGRVQSPDLRVAVDVEGLGRIARTLKVSSTGIVTRLEVEGWSGSKDLLQNTLHLRLGSEPILRTLLHGEAFLEMSHADAKDLLLQILDIKVPLDGRELTLGALDQLYDDAFEARRRAKQDLMAMTVPPKPDDAEVPDVRALEAQLQTLRDEEAKILAARARQEGSDEGQRATLERQRREYQTALTRFTNGLGKYPADREAPVVAAQAALEEHERAHAAALPAAVEGRTRLVEADGRLRVLLPMIEAIRQHRPTRGCVLDSEIPCLTPAANFKKQLGTLGQQADALRIDMEEIRASLTQFEALERTVRECRQQLEQVTLQAHDYERVQGRIQWLTEQLAATDAELASLPAEAPRQDAVALARIRERISKGEQVIKHAAETFRAIRTYEEAVARREGLKIAVDALEQRVAALGPQGVRVKALQGAVMTFEASINEALGRFGYGRFGYALKFWLEPWRIEVNGLAVDLLSTSERLRVGVAFQLALADVTGVGVVAIDQADLLDGPNREALLELLEAWDGQAIVCATRDRPPAPSQGIGVYWLTPSAHGTVIERIEAGAEVSA